MELEKRIYTLTERSLAASPANKSFIELQGSQVLTLDQDSELGKLTQWKTVSPLEFKMHILAMVKQSHDKSTADTSAGQNSKVEDIIAW